MQSAEQLADFLVGAVRYTYYTKESRDQDVSAGAQIIRARDKEIVELCAKKSDASLNARRRIMAVLRDLG